LPQPTAGPDGCGRGSATRSTRGETSTASSRLPGTACRRASCCPAKPAARPNGSSGMITGGSQRAMSSMSSCVMGE
jgi:hypothetical protein